jgi:hypothetical protein
MGEELWTGFPAGPNQFQVSSKEMNQFHFGIHLNV